MKRVNWQISKRLIYGSLVCLSSDEFQTFYFATVCDRDADKLAEGFIDVKFEHQLDEIDAIEPDQQFVMVETTAYYEAYKHVLKGLQDIQHVPFERYIVQSNSSVNPPRYLIDCPPLDLRPLVDDMVKLRGDDDNLRRKIRKQNYEFSDKSKPAENVELLNPRSWPDHELLNVDESQFAALQTALTKEFSVIQGPPGTGKTYVGLKIVKALLHNSSAWNYDGEIKRPMLIVCYTNHALDQFLEGISNFYDGKIVRVGSRISSKKIENYSIHKQTFVDQKQFSDLGIIKEENRKELLELKSQIESIAQKIETDSSKILTASELESVMLPAHREQLSSAGTPSIMLEWLGIALTGKSTNGKRSREEHGPKEDGEGIANIWKINMHKRWRLYRYWESEHCNKLREKITELREIYKTTCETLTEVNLQRDKIIMTEATVVAMTTTGAARYQKILHEVNPRIIVVEEAAEVLEGHVITSLTAGCEQLILIGDHKQLRPNPNVYNLAVKYNLQISLFERMLKNGVHCDCLEIQHRMRPEISKLMKPIYPTLKDHVSVKTFDNVKGMAKNIFFIDHKFDEHQNEEIRSPSNLYEAEFISKLADQKQITILTAYSGQIHQLKQLMPRMRFPGIRITPVDNYQGEENDIILLSLVRSNVEGNIGFLKIENRVCVALSRARKGLYVIGNFGIFASQSSLWREMTIILKKSGELGDKLMLQCQNHPDDSGIEITEPEDFEKNPLSGCQKPCHALLCGHSCDMVCHIKDIEHKEYTCPKPCTKTCKNGHPCQQKCYEKCGDCQTEVKIILACGHTEMVKCSVSDLIHKCTHPCESILDCGHLCGELLCGFPHQCKAMIAKNWPCGHTEEVKCTKFDQAICTKPCRAVLECGHLCTGSCSECFSGRLHKTCRQRCTKKLICDHECQFQCSYCPPCKLRCENRCEHSRCRKACGELCTTCKEPCAWICQHFNCNKKCFEPCDRPPCNHPCNKRLICGHECIGLCGEPCPNLCRICHKDKVTEIFFGTEDEDGARFVQLKDCGHVIEYKRLDNWMKQGTTSSETTSVQMKACPKCKTPIRRCVRYGSIINRLLQSIDEVKQTYIGNKTVIRKLKRELHKNFFSKGSVLDHKETLKIKLYLASNLNQVLAIQNQLELENQLYLSFKLSEIAKEHKPLSVSNKKDFNAIMKEYKKFIDWLYRDRMVFNNQDLNDAQEEIKRLSLYLEFFNQVVTTEKRNVDLSLLEKDIKHCHALFSDGNPLTKRDLQNIKETLKKMKQSATKVMEDDHHVSVKSDCEAREESSVCEDTIDGRNGGML